MMAMLADERGLGLIAAVFVIVVVGLFGSLIARYATLGSVSSAEDYLWAQALYSAQSSAQLAVLYSDGGGTGSYSLSSVGGFTVTTSTVTDGVEASATREINGNAIHRQVQLRVAL